MQDSFDYAAQMRASRRRKFFYALLVLYFLGLFSWGIRVGQEKLDFFVRVQGYKSYPSGERLTMRFFAYGFAEKRPLEDFGVELSVIDPSRGRPWVIGSAYSAGKDYAEIQQNLPNLRPGYYEFLAVVKADPYPPQEVRFNIDITREEVPRAVEIAELTPEQMETGKPLKADSFAPPIHVEILPNNGRLVPNLSNPMLLVAYVRDRLTPVKDLAAIVKSHGKEIAQVTTDVMGLAEFDYYPHSLDEGLVQIRLEDPKETVFSGDYLIAPVGTKLLMRPKKHLYRVDEPLQFDLEGLQSDPVYIDVFKGSNWIYSAKYELHGAKLPIKLRLPVGTEKMVYVQAAYDFLQPGTSFDGFYAYCSPELTKLDNETIVKARQKPKPDIEAFNKMKEIEHEAFLKFWSYVKNSPSYPNDVVEPWLKKINNMGLDEIPVDAEAMARLVLTQLPKEYLLLPLLMDNETQRRDAFNDRQNKRKTTLLYMLVASGVLVVFVILLQILANTKQREDWDELDDVTDEEREALNRHPNKALLWVLGFVVAGYGLICYLLLKLDWAASM